MIPGWAYWIAPLYVVGNALLEDPWRTDGRQIEQGTP